jgi:hypothetical protein
MVQADPRQFKSVNNDLNLGKNLVFLYLLSAVMPAKPPAALRNEGDRPTIATRFRVFSCALAASGWGVFPEA